MSTPPRTTTAMNGSVRTRQMTSLHLLSSACLPRVMSVKGKVQRSVTTHLLTSCPHSQYNKGMYKSVTRECFKMASAGKMGCATIKQNFPHA